MGNIQIQGVTGRTFNLVVEHDDELTEFGMIDYQDYDKIAHYVKPFQAPEEIQVGQEQEVSLMEDEEDDHDYATESGQVIKFNLV